MKASILGKGTAAVTGGLLDSYVAGYWAKDPDAKGLLKSNDLRVGTVLDHQFAYGFVIAGQLKNPDFEKCMRKKLNSMETDITKIIQKRAKTMEVGLYLNTEGNPRVYPRCCW